MLENWIPEKVPLSKLLKNENNPRTITKAKLQKLIESLEGVGIFKPIICTYEYKIIGGTQRNTAILQLMPSTFEVYIMRPPRPLSQEEYDKVLLLDNAHSGEWQMDLLANNFDMSMIEELDIGIDIPPVEVLPTEGLTGEDDVPEVKEPIVKKGDLWLLGEHRLLCGDSTLIDDVDRLMGGEKAEMVFTDPPYGVDYHGSHVGLYRKGDNSNKSVKRIKNDKETDISFIYEGFIGCMRTVLDGPAYIFCGAGKEREVLNVIHESGIDIISSLIWRKDNGSTALNANYKPVYELFYYTKVGKDRRWAGDHSQWTVWELSRNSKNEFHPTQKPIPLIEKALLNHSAKIVLDFFMGSGSTLIACEKTNRKCYGIEIDPHYCTVILNRWRNFTGKEPILESTGQTLKELEEQASS
jgi:DNA modification methylase